MFRMQVKAQARRRRLQATIYFGCIAEATQPQSHGRHLNLLDAGNPLPDLIHAELSATQLGSGRLIVIGDVHGCPDELKTLLRKCQFQQGSDVLVFNGDVVNKGPHSVQVCTLLIGFCKADREAHGSVNTLLRLLPTACT